MPTLNEFDDDDLPDEYDSLIDADDCCQFCDGLGVIITCMDDMCASGDRCIHGDGEEPCGYCAG